MLRFKRIVQHGSSLFSPTRSKCVVNIYSSPIVHPHKSGYRLNL